MCFPFLIYGPNILGYEAVYYCRFIDVSEEHTIYICRKEDNIFSIFLRFRWRVRVPPKHRDFSKILAPNLV